MKHIKLAPKRLPIKEASANQKIYPQGFVVSPVFIKYGGYYRDKFIGHEIRQNKFWFPLKFFINRKDGAKLLDYGTQEILDISTSDEIHMLIIHGNREILYDPITPAKTVYNVVRFKNDETLKHT